MKIRCRFFPLICCLVFVTLELPFLPLGYGIDNDAWRIVSAAAYIAEHGCYAASRFPGYPVPELIYALFCRLGVLAPALFNTVTMLMACVSIVAFWEICRRLKVAYAELAVVAFAFTPLVFLNSNTTMDYMWSLAFLLLSFYAVITERPLLAGAFLGTAVGCRITALLMLVPFGMWLWQHVGVKTWKFALMSGLMSLLCWSPVIATYGLGFWRWYDYQEAQLTEITIRKAVVDPFGFVGFLGVTLVPITDGLRRQLRTGNHAVMQVSALVVGLVSLMFLRLPHEAEYVLPSVPFFILLLWQVVPLRKLRLITVCLVVSCLIVGIENHRARVEYHSPSVLPEIELNGTSH